MSINDIQNTTHRFSDVAGEPCIMLAPIDGFIKKPLVTLNEAIKPLESIVPRINQYAYTALHRAENPANNLTVHESAAIALYTMEWPQYNESLYYILNATLRTEDRQNLKPWFLYLKLIFTALSRLPSTSLTIYRGVQFNIEGEYEKYRVGKELIWWGFSSCSTNRNISEKDQFLGQTGRRILFAIDCIKGKDIGQHSYFKKESEVLLLPATKVKVMSHEYQGNGLDIVHLIEKESPLDVLRPSSQEEIEALRKKPIFDGKIPEPKPATEPDIYHNASLQAYIARCKPRSEVYLIGKYFTEDDMEVVVQQLVIEKQCRQLFLREGGITSRGAMIISNALRDNNTLELLFISQNKIGDEGARALADALSNNKNLTLQQLCLGGNSITDEGIEHLARMLESNKTLTHLYLPSNEISDRGLQRLAEVLTNKNKTLQLLSLEWNKFHNDSSVDILINMINNNRSLTQLNLNSCKLSRTAIKQLKSVGKARTNFKLTLH